MKFARKKYRNGKLEYLSTTDEKDQRTHHNVQCNRWTDNFSTARVKIKRNIHEYKYKRGKQISYTMKKHEQQPTG